MKLKLFIITIIAFSFAIVGLLGGCGGGSNNEVLVESIAVDVDLDWIKNDAGIKPNTSFQGYEYSFVSNIYRNTYFWSYNNSANNSFFEYFRTTASEDSQLVALFVYRDTPLKLKFNITPSNATNKALTFTAHKVNPSFDSSYDGWAGAAGDEVNIEDYVTITTNGEITLKSSFESYATIRITATTTDGSNKSFSFDIWKKFSV